MNVNLRIEKIANGFVVRADAEVLGYDMTGSGTLYFATEAEMNTALPGIISERIKQAEDFRSPDAQAQFQRVASQSRMIGY